jgi:hypothetical protein
MKLLGRSFLLVGMYAVVAASAHAQIGVDPSGHWEGTVQAPEMIITFHVDVAKNRDGSLRGTISIPTQGVKGLPLAKLVVEGSAVSFGVRTDQLFKAVVSSDGQSMSGDFNVTGFAAPFSLTRTGEAVIEPTPASARISKELEGTWNLTLGAEGKQLRLVLKMTNQPDGTATGSVVNLDEGGLELPVVITQDGSNVTLRATAVKSSFSGVLNREGTQLTGTLSQGPVVVPITFERSAIR